MKIGNDMPGEVGITDNIFPKGLWGNCTLEGFVPKATLRNNSSSSINTPFNITYKITGPVSFTSTKSDTISGNHTKIIYFDSLNNINIPGVYNVKIYSCLESDINRSNDTLTSTFTLSPSNYGGGATAADQGALDGGGVPVVAGHEQPLTEGDGTPDVQRRQHRGQGGLQCANSQCPRRSIVK